MHVRMFGGQVHVILDITVSHVVMLGSTYHPSWSRLAYLLILYGFWGISVGSGGFIMTRTSIVDVRLCHLSVSILFL